jgi:hypothetical protein
MSCVLKWSINPSIQSRTPSIVTLTCVINTTRLLVQEITMCHKMLIILQIQKTLLRHILMC